MNTRTNWLHYFARLTYLYTILGLIIVKVYDTVLDGVSDQLFGIALSCVITLSISIVLTVLWIAFYSGYERHKKSQKILLSLFLNIFYIPAELFGENKKYALHQFTSAFIPALTIIALLLVEKIGIENSKITLVISSVLIVAQLVYSDVIIVRNSKANRKLTILWLVFSIMFPIIVPPIYIEFYCRTDDNNLR